MNKLFKNLDYLIPVLTIALVLCGLFLIFSATKSHDTSLLNNTFLKKQVIAALLGIVAVIITLLVNYEVLRDYAEIVYIADLLLLGIVLVIGQTVKGGQSWISLGRFNFQPAEITKLIVIIMLAHVLAKEKYKVKNILGLIVPGLYVFIPFSLILLQNDLGSSLVLIAIFIGMIYVAGANALFLFGSIFGVIASVVTWVTAHIYLGVYIPLKDYQLNRLLVLVNPSRDPLGAGYNVRQSKIAIGSGGFFGKGLFTGSQNQLNFLPEKHTDFIFSVLGEELGFIGALIVLILYFILLWRALVVAKEAKDKFGEYVVVGVISMLSFHIFQNIGMAVGLMPVTGIPLPFLSYGGSSLITNLLAIGLIMNINMRKKKLMF
ncbi:rod shape-determining protein RodA [Halanaerobacter jeridensis]|uniref:Peptidoglycan glycosyltransferase RodA n=1 Tax=Halanaerobacter jeridensis TaxID=706427 RepID=A0A938XRP5_9FIRM|nr:rod shape-determining protein RodA [Halanaerobacter jeridensis]MBM7556188.1 rod shape determining protein RodA [Halanaerobacter jeridensis]